MKANLPLDVFPYYVEREPGFTKELLRRIRQSCIDGRPLNEEERAYLAKGIERILNGLPADRALYLTRRAKGRGTLSGRNIEIYNCYANLRNKGWSKNAAFKEIANQAIAAKKRSDTILSAKAVEKICTNIDKALGTPKKLVEEK